MQQMGVNELKTLVPLIYDHVNLYVRFFFQSIEISRQDRPAITADLED
ncbi:hypothetical protein H6F90_11265 [Trichocoleus sp. FACHB-591]|nr:hypothetical protein [Trichocoleus sp. FACHB-591]MBD2095732.1 hypothetical protein [Trichocoleus sp. FACHB-591]